ncbi:MAG: N-acetylmuramoyl-L-alanine amidase [Verrucomicrobiota bacterium]
MNALALFRFSLVKRLPVLFGAIVALGAIATTLLHAQSGDEEKKKREARAKAREEMRAIASPTPSETPEPTAKPKPAKHKGKSKKHPTPKPSVTPKKSPTPEPDESPTPKAATKKANADEDEATPKPKQTESPAIKKKAAPDETPKPGLKGKHRKKGASAKKETTPKPKRIEKAEAVKTPSPAPSTPKPSAAEPARSPSPSPTPVSRAAIPPLPPANLPADITIEKSGLQQEQGMEPPPPAPARKSFWSWGRRTNYRYLTSATIDAIRRAQVQRARWKFIIVHNSGTRQGNARAFDYYHRHVRRMRNGLAYHFVIGNGTSSRNGAIEIGDRWRRQINGGHVHSDYLNNIALGICLVGDFNRQQPTQAQLDACEELIRYLRERCGKSDGHTQIVRPHREVNPPRWATDCPGDVFPYPWFRRFQE